MQRDERAGTDRGASRAPDQKHQARRFADVNIARRTATVVLVLTYGWWAVSLPPFSALATMAVLVPGGAAVVLGTLRPRPQRRRYRTGGVGFWVAIAATAACWQLVAHLQRPRAGHPTLSSLANALLDSQYMRAAAFVLWLLAMVGLARR